MEEEGSCKGNLGIPLGWTERNSGLWRKMPAKESGLMRAGGIMSTPPRGAGTGDSWRQQLPPAKDAPLLGSPTQGPPQSQTPNNGDQPQPRMQEAELVSEPDIGVSWDLPVTCV